VGVKNKEEGMGGSEKLINKNPPEGEGKGREERLFFFPVLTEGEKGKEEGKIDGSF